MLAHQRTRCLAAVTEGEPLPVTREPLLRFNEVFTPTSVEVEALARARRTRREFRRRQVICRHGERVSDIYLLVQGWVASSVDVDSCRRQMVKLHFPGDFLGMPNIALATSAETLIALTAGSVDVIPLDALGRLFETAPRLAFALFVTSQHERVMLMDQLAAIGQTSATQRICALLLYVSRRLKPFDPLAAEAFEWPLSQEHVAQATALSAIHVNRTLRNLEQMGLIARERRRIRLLDLERLEALAAFPERRLVREPSWLTSVMESACRVNNL